MAAALARSTSVLDGRRFAKRVKQEATRYPPMISKSKGARWQFERLVGDTYENEMWWRQTGL